MREGLGRDGHEPGSGPTPEGLFLWRRRIDDIDYQLGSSSFYVVALRGDERTHLSCALEWVLLPGRSLLDHKM